MILRCPAVSPRTGRRCTRIKNHSFQHSTFSYIGNGDTDPRLPVFDADHDPRGYFLPPGSLDPDVPDLIAHDATPPDPHAKFYGDGEECT